MDFQGKHFLGQYQLALCQYQLSFVSQNIQLPFVGTKGLVNVTYSNSVSII